MTGTGEITEQAARDLLGLMFDDGGFEVPADDLAPGAVAGYRRLRRRRAALTGAGTTVVAAGIAVAALVSGGGGARGGTTPGVWSTPATSGTPATSPASMVTSSTALAVPTAPASASGSPAGRPRIDCFTNLALDRDQLMFDNVTASCARVRQLWEAVFPHGTVKGRWVPNSAPLTQDFAARVAAQGAAGKDLYGVAQERVVQDWADAYRTQSENGYQHWAMFTIDSPELSGPIPVSAGYRDHTDAGAGLPCGGGASCESVPLSDGGRAEVSESGGGYAVTVRNASGDAYVITLMNEPTPRYVDIPCADGDGPACYADLTDGAIRPGHRPDSAPDIHTAVPLTRSQLLSILSRPAFAALAQDLFAEHLGR